MAYGYLIVVLLGIGLIVLGFYGAFLYQGKKYIQSIYSILMPIGLVITLLGIILTVLPDFFRETIW